MVEILSAPELTRQMYRDFLGVARRVQEGKIEESAFVQAAAAIDPRLERVAKLALRHKGWAFIALLVIWLNSCVSLDVKLDTNRLLDQVFGQPGIEYVLPNQPVDELYRDLDGKNTNPAEGGAEQKQRNFDPLLAPRKQALLMSVSALAIAAKAH
ncbi:MAG: hypothetical protein ACTHNH_21135 [Mesorhizobium sp.]